MKILVQYSKNYTELPEMILPYIEQEEGNELVIRQFKGRENVNFGTEDFNLTCHDMYDNAVILMKEMKENDILLYVDADILLNARPSWFAEQLGDNDVVFQYETGFGMCLGFFVCKINERVIDAFERTTQATGEQDNAQIEFKKLLPTFNLKIGYFDTKDVWNYGVYSNGQIWNGEPFELPETLKAFHANFTIGLENKKKLLEMAIQKYKI